MCGPPKNYPSPVLYVDPNEIFKNTYVDPRKLTQSSSLCDSDEIYVDPRKTTPDQMNLSKSEYPRLDQEQGLFEPHPLPLKGSTSPPPPKSPRTIYTIQNSSCWAQINEMSRWHWVGKSKYRQNGPKFQQWDQHPISDS